MATIEEKQISKELVIELVKNNGLSYDGFPDAKNPLDLVCEAYKTILKTVSETE